MVSNVGDDSIFSLRLIPEFWSFVDRSGSEEQPQLCSRFLNDSNSETEAYGLNYYLDCVRLFDPDRALYWRSGTNEEVLRNCLRSGLWEKVLTWKWRIWD